MTPTFEWIYVWSSSPAFVSKCSAPDWLVITAFGDVRRKDLTWDNFDRSAFNEADFPSWVRIRELRRSECAEVVWEVHIKHPDDIIGWNVFGGIRSDSLYPDGVEEAPRRTGMGQNSGVPERERTCKVQRRDNVELAAL